MSIKLCEWGHAREDGTVETCEQPACGQTLVFQEGHVCGDCQKYGKNKTGCPDFDTVAVADYCTKHMMETLEEEEGNVRLFVEHKD